MPITLNSIEFIAFRGNNYSEIQERLHGLGKIAQAIGCPTIVVVPSPLPDRNLPWADVIAEYVKVLRDLSEIALLYNIKLSFEFLGFGWCSVRTPRAAFEIIQNVDRDNIGLTIDAAHFYGGGGLMSELDQLDPERIFAFHLDDLEDTPKEAIIDSTRLLPGLGVVPLDDICARLKTHRLQRAMLYRTFPTRVLELGSPGIGNQSPSGSTKGAVTVFSTRLKLETKFTTKGERLK